ncbi:ubiquitin carboxyl-terminal hydrolase [Babesia caballi]|uniref:ubiquitinyl hydrolase 1 n=1 Tax=Babesia caballi TaxID=5871 RepID=A0AAV4LUB4_BABCB|nr:ubiquitin carboxyl-terminal hydrolase [Babesia caballi]
MHLLRQLLGYGNEAPKGGRSGPCGLDNALNNCYCNAVLQALFTVAGFRTQAIQMQNYEAEISSALGRLYSRCDTGTGVQSARNLLLRIYKQTDTFVLGDQQDAHEFLTYLINTMMDEIKALQKRHSLVLSSDYSSSDDMQEEGRRGSSSGQHGALTPVENANPYKIGSTWVSQLFEGSLRSETTCHSCKTVTGTMEPFITISVDIFESCDIAHCIKQYCTAELLTGKNQFFCDTCHEYTDASKRVVFEQLPPVLIVHLKRFMFTATCVDSNNNSVLCSDVRRLPYSVVTNRTITMESRRQQKAVVYELFAVVSHVGTSPHYGHYVALAELGGIWYACDDLYVSRVSNVSRRLGDEDTDGNPDSYIVFYRMRNTDAS